MGTGDLQTDISVENSTSIFLLSQYLLTLKIVLKKRYKEVCIILLNSIRIKDRHTQRGLSTKLERYELIYLDKLIEQ